MSRRPNSLTTCPHKGSQRWLHLCVVDLGDTRGEHELVRVAVRRADLGVQLLGSTGHEGEVNLLARLSSSPVKGAVLSNGEALVVGGRDGG